jgi:hypothetical protein
MNGKRKVYLGIGLLGICTSIMFMGAIPAFAYLQVHVGEVLRTIIWITGVLVAGNVGEHFSNKK